MFNKDVALAQIDEALNDWKTARSRSKYDELTDLGDTTVALISGRLSSVIGRLAPIGSEHHRILNQTISKYGNNWQTIAPLSGLLLALRRDYELGYLSSVEELVHADTFSGFLDMASHLQEKKYKDPAAVLAGSVLEQHLRSLGIKHGLNVMSGDKFKKAETLNTELSGAGIYSKLDQKNVTSWLGLRNDAAHGNYNNYTNEQVGLMIDAIANFLTRVVA